MSGTSGRRSGPTIAKELVTTVIVNGTRAVTKVVPAVNPSKLASVAGSCCQGIGATLKCAAGLVRPGCQCYCCVLALLFLTIGIMWLVIKYYQWRLGDDHLAVLLRATG